MKRILCGLLTISMICTMITIPTMAVDADDSTITSNEQLCIDEAMKLREIGGDLTIDVLLDIDGNPSFLLGMTENGYIIMNRDTMTFLEGGERNPYDKFDNQVKYYGGFSCYYVVATENKTANDTPPLYFDIVHNKYTNEMDQLLMPNHNDSTPSTDNSFSRAPAVGTLIKTEKIDNAYNYIRRRAFGYNNDNTCSAIAVSIALNYISMQESLEFIAADSRLELLTGKAYASDISNKYPNANALHRYLTDTCNMDAVSYASGITDPFESYVENMVDPSLDIRLSWTLLPRMSTIESNIDQNKPVLITTALAGDHSWHTMVVYGYRNYTMGNELLVHTGWYTDVTNANGSWDISETWVLFDVATYGYYFDYS